jgi:transcriptional regulator with XRE-family HTH domain
MAATDRLLAELMASLGVVLKAQRVRKGLSRGVLAEMVGVSETTIGRIERSGPVDLGVTWQIARALEIPLSDLVRDAERLWGERVRRSAEFSALRQQLVELLERIVPPDPSRPAVDYFWSSIPIDVKVPNLGTRHSSQVEGAAAQLPTVAHARKAKAARLSEVVQEAADAQDSE